MVMSKRKEKISAFLDNDMHRDELMSFSLSAESDDAEIAQRYQLMGEALRGELSNSSFIDVSDAVREALADENIAIDNQSEQISTETSLSSKSNNGRFDLSAWFRPVAGMAVAASVAVVMVVTLSEQETGTLATVAENVEKQPAVQVAADKKATDLDPHVDQHLVNQHLEFATQDALQGRLPYVRAVSYETQNKPLEAESKPLK